MLMQGGGASLLHSPRGDWACQGGCLCLHLTPQRDPGLSGAQGPRRCGRQKQRHTALPFSEELPVRWPRLT